MGVSEIIYTIKESWFLSEPLLFATICTHDVVENKRIPCGIRSGKMRIEYNPDVLGDIDKDTMESVLRREVIRVLLKHQYQRMPINAIPKILILASNITIYQHGGIGSDTEKSFSRLLPSMLSFEEYYNMLLHMLDDIKSDDKNSNYTDYDNLSNSQGDSDSKPDDIDKKNYGFHSLSKGLSETELWEENEMMSNRIDNLIEQATASRQWGSLRGSIRELIRASLEKKINIRRQLALFKTSILSTERRLTRMRPSRRYGWGQMGTVHPYTTRLLVAVDVSGSVQSNDISRFFSIINSFFLYGIPFIDVLQFDAEIKLPLLTFRKAKVNVEIIGRSGTNFQPVIDYYDNHKEYDGMIVFTDGYAEIPQRKTSRRILWVLQNIESYNDFKLSPKIYI